MLPTHFAWPYPCGITGGITSCERLGAAPAHAVGAMAFEDAPPDVADVTVGVLSGSVLAALLAAIVLRVRNAAYRRIAATEDQ